MYHKLKPILQIILCCCLPFSALATTPMTSSEHPIEIVSDKVVYEKNSGNIIYTGTVIVISGEKKLCADEVIVKRSAEQNIESIHATGTPAQFSTLMKDEITPVHAYAFEIDYIPNDSLLVLTGQAKIIHQQDTFEGPILKYKIDQQKIEAIQAQNQRPKMIITPPKKG